MQTVISEYDKGGGPAGAGEHGPAARGRALDAAPQPAQHVRADMRVAEEGAGKGSAGERPEAVPENREGGEGCSGQMGCGAEDYCARDVLVEEPEAVPVQFAAVGPGAHAVEAYEDGVAQADEEDEKGQRPGAAGAWAHEQQGEGQAEGLYFFHWGLREPRG